MFIDSGAEEETKAFREEDPLTGTCQKNPGYFILEYTCVLLCLDSQKE